MSKNNDDMIGFQDFLSSQEEKRSKRSSRQIDSGHEIVTFLEKENQRLDRLTKLYTEKVRIIKSYPQEAALINDLEQKISVQKQLLQDQLDKEESHYRRNLRDLYRMHFNS